MWRLFSTFLIGSIFGLGITISGMINPAKVLNFFDLAGSWDPSLIFVMGGALVTAVIGYTLIFRLSPKPKFEANFNLPTNRKIDKRLLAGAALFGLGWGIAGFCPGGAIPALGLGYSETLIFTAMMMIGIFAAKNVKAIANFGGKKPIPSKP